jgi:hypothetical protein
VVAVIRNRRQVRATPSVFAYVARTDDGWTRRLGYARWVSDVLIIHRGPALVRTDARQVIDHANLGRPAHPPKRFGGSAIVLKLTFADGTTMRMAVDERAVRDLTAGGTVDD